MHTDLRTRFLLVVPKWCPGRDLNPHSACAKKDFKSFASADFATRAYNRAILLNQRIPDLISLMIMNALAPDVLIA